MNSVCVVGEGTIDVEVCRRLVSVLGLKVGELRPMGGAPQLDQRLHAFNQAAKRSRWFVLRDLDSGCAVETRKRLLPHAAEQMCFRIAVYEVESWLLADKVNISAYLHVSEVRLPEAPDSIRDPKQLLVNIARKSRSPLIREGIVPREGSVRIVGPGYTTLVTEFITEHWDPEKAAARSDSLMRCLRELRRWK